MNALRRSAEAQWNRKEALIDNAGVECFTHPADAMEAFVDEQPKAEVHEIFVRLMLRCLPTKAHGIHRTRVGYRRFCVLVYLCGPTYFEGMAKRDLAKYLGITTRALRKEFELVRGELAVSKPMTINCKRMPTKGKSNA